MRSAVAHILLAVTLLSGCGPERELSGVWRERCDGDTCRAFVYELHLGRYGDDLGGLVVRYQSQGSELDSFEGAWACGCFFLSGGRADGDALVFQLFRPDSPGDDEASATCVAESPLECEGRLFELELDGDELVGVTRCGVDGEPTSIRFESVRGQVRTRCAQEAQ